MSGFEIKNKAEMLYRRFGTKAIFVVDELLDAAASGYSYDEEYEKPFLEAVRRDIVERQARDKRSEKPNLKVTK